jgi:hypothetical protein
MRIDVSIPGRLLPISTTPAANKKTYIYILCNLKVITMKRLFSILVAGVLFVSCGSKKTPDKKLSEPVQADTVASKADNMQMQSSEKMKSIEEEEPLKMSLDSIKTQTRRPHR